ncbi:MULTISPECIES: hypothetical protein [unclassified Exiguobacterium]|uniref:hypothetical protein n=1 Tax=unclassified Exiguobacterium TaxID=2644629 RepID=UPI00103F77DC|nr:MULTISPECIES: hypothetical protein [unclassified Exiguobacterium]TCI34434.1 hypothetical protein EVJ29_11210 [Exiguobacterium sp. SH4S7]TCI44187.1 hypothetical protein EVJ31_10040 [Exiguobacterium sp. SH5S32]TCI50453.1 hypothetical protein EVJ25_11005 [Exiguobacterium sp. SH1S4]TCI69411.1 hypothetical protein EVJ23_10030 [Exiguobacterium sp. SH1S1]TCI76970.1 hypothetical protein EVJ20_09635 [Exiguobacterium sp. SH0S1]
MHQIELGNDDVTVRFIIAEANRTTLKLVLARDAEMVRTADYVSFGRDLTEAYEQLSGKAHLQNESGRTILTIAFERGRVDVSIAWGQGVTTFVTDQSYLTKTLGQIGPFE